VIRSCSAKAALIGVIVCGATARETVPPRLDIRTEKLETFFRAYNCPAPHHIDEYLSAADAKSIDYRLLPAISVVESTCGSYERMNNRWGWNNAQSGFPSVREGIEFISAQLAENPSYKDKPIEEKLVTYNPDWLYVRQVQRLMRQIGN